jgi:hypothetical protein
MKRTFIPLSLLTLLLCASQTSRACVCTGLDTRLSLLRGEIVAVHDYQPMPHEAIFSGKVTRVRRVTLNHKVMSEVTFRVERYWAGVESAEVVIYAGFSSCDIRFRKGDRLIVFARVIEGRLKTNGCSYTAPQRYEANLVKGLRLGAGTEPGQHDPNH